MEEKIIICERCGGNEWILLTQKINKSGGIPETMKCKKCSNIFPIPTKDVKKAFDELLKEWKVRGGDVDDPKFDRIPLEDIYNQAKKLGVE